jgi:hypothetical protein
MASNPELVRQSRAGQHGWLDGFELTPLELDRLALMACDDRMEINCSLYRSNRLTALVRTVPTVVDALGDRLRDAVTEFWLGHPETDLQFQTEARAFCDFIRIGYPDLAPVIAEAEDELRLHFS